MRLRKSHPQQQRGLGLRARSAFFDTFLLRVGYPTTENAMAFVVTWLLGRLSPPGAKFKDWITVADYVKTADKAKAIAQAHHDSGGSA
jgi:hypothetical protein